MNLETAIKIAGGVGAVAAKCDVSRNAVYKWLNQNRMPLGDLTGRSTHSRIIADMINEKGIPGANVSPEDICPYFGQYALSEENDA